MQMVPLFCPAHFARTRQLGYKPFVVVVSPLNNPDDVVADYGWLHDPMSDSAAGGRGLIVVRRAVD
jgi:hypothetical protein